MKIWEEEVNSSMGTATTATFYAQLPAFTAFEGFIEKDHFKALPEDWYVVIADIQGSTQAIHQGRYREVNAVGVASIVAVLNALKPLEIPFVFGGDGATFAVPHPSLNDALNALAACAAMAKDNFNLALRVGSVCVKHLHQQHAPVWVGKFVANDHYHQAMLLGEGWSLAEKIIKEDMQFQSPLVLSANQGDFSGFECRWNEIKSTAGETVSLLVLALSKDVEKKRAIYEKLWQQIQAIYGSEESYHPVSLTHLHLSPSWHKLYVETKIRQYSTQLSRWRYRLVAWLQIWAGKYLMKRGITTEATQWGEYKNRLRANTDYRKFDDMLRMVIAGNTVQRHALERYLVQEHLAGNLVYGLHVSDAALITCMVADYNYRHWHFLDGAGGGYAMAAIQLKQQLAEKKSVS